MIHLIRVLFDVSRMTFADLLSRANAVHAGMSENPAYPTPPVPMSEFRLAIDEYAAALAAALDGGATPIALRNAKRDRLSGILRQQARYVEANCKDDMTIFLSSGFQAATAARSQRNPLSDSIRKVEPGASGELRIVLVRNPDAVSYGLRWAPITAGGALGEWTSLPVPSTRPPTSVTGLTPGTTYAFQARALTRSGFTGWSDSVTRICN